MQWQRTCIYNNDKLFIENEKARAAANSYGTGLSTLARSGFESDFERSRCSDAVKALLDEKLIPKSFIEFQEELGKGKSCNTYMKLGDKGICCRNGKISIV